MKYFLWYLFVAIGLIFPAQASSLKGIWQEMQATLAAADAGATDWQDTTFGRVRLLGCQSGVTPGQSVFLGLEADISPDITIALPTFRVSVGDGNDALVLTPFQGEQQTSWADNYTGLTFFPIRVSRQTPGDSFPVTVTADVVFTTPDGYRMDTVTQTLVLDGTHNRPTTWCGRIHYALTSAAVPTDRTNISAKAFLADNGEIQMRLTFPKDINHIQLQTEPALAEITHHIRDNIAFYSFYPTTPVHTGDTVSVRIKTDKGFYLTDIPLGTTPLPTLPPDFPWFWAICGGFLFFVMTPLWGLWWEPGGQTVDQARAQTRRQRNRLIPIVALSALLVLTGGNTWIQSIPLAAWLFIPVIGYYLYKPTGGLVWATVGLLILPKPFAENVHSFWYAVLIAMTWTIVALFPFGLKMKKARGFWTFLTDCRAENAPAYRIIRRLPFLILTGWLVGILMLSGREIPLEEPTTLTPETPTLVSIERPMCLGCLWERDHVLQTSIATNMMTFHRIRHVAWPTWVTKSDWIKQHELDKANHWLLLPNGYVYALPKGLTVKKLADFLDRLH